MSRRKRSEERGFNTWRSYSDLMAGVLLLFLLIMCVTLFQAQKSYDESIQERDEKIALQEQYTAELLAKQNALDEKDGQIQSQDEQLQTQSMLLAEQQKKLDELAAQLALQQQTLNEQQTALDEKTTQLAIQQQKIDNIIGVKAEVVESLQQEFASQNVDVNIDSQTGALTLNANVMFDYDSADLTEEGMAVLREVLPIYCKVLLEEEYQSYLAEIIIAGYTDNDGDYVYNMELSQRRALAVAQYLMDIQQEFLSAEEQIDLRNFLAVNGHSMSNPILDAEGNIDKDASRRVEVKFRLKDEEMITELNNIMSVQE